MVSIVFMLQPPSGLWFPFRPGTIYATNFGCFTVRHPGSSSGDHKGVDAITAALVGAFKTTGGTQKLDVSKVFADELHVVLNIHETASRPDGAALDMDEVHLLSFNDRGQITDSWDIPAGPETHDRFFDGA